jgi:hypothetical protein
MVSCGCSETLGSSEVHIAEDNGMNGLSSTLRKSIQVLQSRSWKLIEEKSPHLCLIVPKSFKDVLSQASRGF